MKRQVLAIVAIFMLLSLACSFLQPKNQSPTDGAGATVEGGAGGKDNGDDSPPKDSGDSSEDGGGTSGDDEGFSLDADAFAQLDYYRSTTVMSYDKGDGTVEETTIEAAYIREPAAQSIQVASNTESMQVIKIVDQMWVKFGDEWMQTSADEDTDMAEGFASMLGTSEDIEDYEKGDYKYMGSETIDGIKTRHYQGKTIAPWMMAFTNQADNVDMKKGVLDIWIADERDLPKFVVKMTLVMEGTVNDANATYTMSQTVTDINQPFTIEPPAAAEIGGLPEGVPMYPDATDVTTFGGMTVFTSGDSISDVADFYNSALESGGWEQTENTEMEEMVSSQWLKDGVTLSLNITPGDPGTSVMIITGEE